VAFLELGLVRLQRLASSLVARKYRQFRDLSRCHEFVTGMKRDLRVTRAELIAPDAKPHATQPPKEEIQPMNKLSAFAIALFASTTIGTAWADQDDRKLDHVFVIMMENHGYKEIIGSPYMPSPIKRRRRPIRRKTISPSRIRA